MNWCTRNEEMCSKHSRNRLPCSDLYFDFTFQLSSKGACPGSSLHLLLLGSECRQHCSARPPLLMCISSSAHPERGGTRFVLHRQSFICVTSEGLAWLHPGHASVCACERQRPCSCERPTCDPHLVLISSHNAPLSLQKHLFRPPYVTEVCKTECSHRVFRLKNVTLPKPGCC